MNHWLRTIRTVTIAAALLLTAAQAIAQTATSPDYQAKLAQYTRAHQAYEEEASAYWDQWSTSAAAATPSAAPTSRLPPMITC
jgi:hypothetical protein